MSDTTRAAPPPHDRRDPYRTGAAEPTAGRTDWVDPFGSTGPTDRSRPSPGPEPLRVRPADPEAALSPDLAVRRQEPQRRPAPPPRKDRGALGWVNAALVYSGAALLGASIYQGKRTSAAEAGHPPVGRFLESDGATFHYVDIGEGPPIVLLHGIGSTLDDWFVSGVLDRLLPHHRIIAIDRPGYGYSSRPGGTRWTPERQARAMARMLHRLGAHEATVVAHSFGVLPAMALALQHPTFARNLVLIGGVYMPGSFLGRLSKAVPSVPLLGPLARGSVSPALARAALPSLVRTMFEPQPVTRAFRERFSMDFATRPGQLRAAADDLGMIDRVTRRFLPHYRELDVPVAVVTGSGDAIFDPDLQSRPFAATVPNASLVVIPAGGHLVHHTSPDLVSEVILETAAGRIQPSDLGPPPDVRAGPLEETSEAPREEPEPAGSSQETAVRDQSLQSSQSMAAEPSPEPEESRSTVAPTADEQQQPRRRGRPEPVSAEAETPRAETTRARAATSRAGATGVSDLAQDDEPGAARGATTEETPSALSAVGPASSATAARAAATDEGGADQDSTAGTAEDEGESAAPERRRSRSRRKTD